MDGAGAERTSILRKGGRLSENRPFTSCTLGSTAGKMPLVENAAFPKPAVPSWDHASGSPGHPIGAIMSGAPRRW